MELDSAKAVSPEGEGRPSCSWAGRLLRRKGPAGRQQPQPAAGYSQVPPIATPQRVKPCRGRVAVGLRCTEELGERAPWHIQTELGEQVSVEFPMDILASALSAMTGTSSTVAAGGSISLWPQELLWREIPHTSTQRPLVGRPSPGVAIDLGFPKQARPG